MVFVPFNYVTCPVYDILGIRTNHQFPQKIHGPGLVHEPLQLSTTDFLLGDTALQRAGCGGILRQHPGRLTWNLQITYLERKMIFQTSMIMFHVNLPWWICWRDWRFQDSPTFPMDSVTSWRLFFRRIARILPSFSEHGFQRLQR